MDIRTDTTTVDAADIVSSIADTTILPGVGNVLSTSDELGDFIKTLDPNHKEQEEAEEDHSEKVTSILDDLIKAEGGEDIEEGTALENKGGRSKIEKSSLTSYLKSKIEGNEFFAYDDWDEKKETLESYLSKQPEKNLHELLDANWKHREEELKAKTPKDFYNALPEELQYVARYVMEGGTDLKSVFKGLSAIEEIKALDESDEDDQEIIVRNYLQAKEFGSREQIEEMISDLKSSDKLGKRAREYKPMLDSMQKEVIEYQTAQAAQAAREMQEIGKAYMNGIKTTLTKGDVGGFKLSGKEKSDLFTGLVTNDFTTSFGHPTNRLGYLMDQVQFVNPNYELLLEVVLHLEDPKGFKEKIGQQYKNEAVADIAKKLKTEQGKGGSSVGASLGTEVEDKGLVKKLPKSVLAGWK